MSIETHVNWVHGHSGQIEDPANIESVLRTGSGIQVEGKKGTTNWLHFAVPTPTTVGELKMHLRAVMLAFTTMSADASVQQIHIYDGAERIAAFDDLNLSGDVGLKRFDLPGVQPLNGGVGISVGVKFGVEAASHGMKFTSAGCDFQGPILY